MQSIRLPARWFMCGSASLNNARNLQIKWRQSLAWSKRCFLDTSKAFDRVWHYVLLYKLKLLGICSTYYNLIKSFLNNRHQRAVLTGQSLKWSLVEAGIPQDSILGPLFFFIKLMICHKDCVVMQNWRHLLGTLHFSQQSLVLQYHHQTLMKTYLK